MADSFICSVCGEAHQGPVNDTAFTLPDDVWAIPEAERAEQARFDSDRCQFGDRFFIRCILTVGIPGSDASYGWGAWAEVELAVFMRYLELYDADGSTEPMHPGRLANALWPYPCSLGEQVWIQFRDATSRPELYLPKDAESLLAKEQREGMDAARYHQILEGRGR